MLEADLANGMPTRPSKCACDEIVLTLKGAPLLKSQSFLALVLPLHVGEYGPSCPWIHLP